MECNKDEAKRAMDIAEKKLSENDYVGAKKFLTKAQNLYPNLDGLNQVSMMIHVYISAAENKINGGKESDLYGVLGVDHLADDEALKKQYKKLALLLHPDKNKFKCAEGAFRLVLNAWSLLSDKAKRSAYDLRRKLSTGMQKPPAPSQHNNKPPGSSNMHPNARPPPYAPKPASSSANQNANTRSNHPNASGPQRQPPYAPKPASAGTNQSASRNGVNPSANTRTNQPASGPQRPPPYAPKPGSSGGNPNANRDGVHPSGPQKPPNPHRPASSSANQNANTRSSKPAPTPGPAPGSGPAPVPPNPHRPAYYSANPSVNTGSSKPAPAPSPAHVPANPHRPASSSTNPSANTRSNHPASGDGVHPGADTTSNHPAPAPTPGPAPVPGPVPVNSWKQMFWTVCNDCKTRSEYRRDLYLNKTMRCQNCGQSYIATERNPWDRYVNTFNSALLSILRQKQQWSSSAQNGGGASSFSSSSSPFVGATKDQWESYLTQVNYTLSLVVQRQHQWVAQNQAANTTTSSQYVGSTPQDTFAMQHVYSTVSLLLQLQQQRRTAANNKATPSVTPHANVVRPRVNVSSSSPQQQQCGSQNTSSGTNYPSPSVSAAMKTPQGSFVSPAGVNLSSSSPQQQQWGGQNTSVGATYNSSSSVHHKCSVSVPASSNSVNASAAQERCKRGCDDDSQAAIEQIFKKLKRDVV